MSDIKKVRRPYCNRVCTHPKNHGYNDAWDDGIYSIEEMMANGMPEADAEYVWVSTNDRGKEIFHANYKQGQDLPPAEEENPEDIFFEEGDNHVS